MMIARVQRVHLCFYSKMNNIITRLIPCSNLKCNRQQSSREVVSIQFTENDDVFKVQMTC